MSIIDNYEELIARDFPEGKSLIKQNEIDALVKELQFLEGSTEKQGYTIPMKDTIGLNLKNRFYCQIEDI